MIYYPRILCDLVMDSLRPTKVILIVGARRVGKTILLSQIIDKIREKYILLDGEDFTINDLLQGQRVEQYRRLMEDKSLLIIDEAQKIENIGAIIKLMVDHIRGLKVILTGSSAIDLGKSFGEALTGRKITFQMFALSQKEFSQIDDPMQREINLEERMIYGCYPEVWQLNNRKVKINFLKELVNDYLFRDILLLENIRNASKLKNLLRLIAFQIGKEVSNEELGRQLGMSKNTVERYLDLLSKVFIIFKIQGYSKNLRKEVTKNYRWYFYDNGILDTFTANFNVLKMRQDVGALWENFILSERIKYLSYNRDYSNVYFWRTYDQQEIDWVEEKDGNLHGFEIKWGDKRLRVPGAWKRGYPEADFTVINKSNYLEWIEE